MADRDVELHIKTTADKAGADAAAQAMEKVAAADAKAEQAATQAAAAEQKEAAALQQVHAAATPAAAAVEKVAAAENATSQAVTKSAAATQSAQKTVVRYTESKKEAATATGNAGYRLQVFGQIAQDAQYGIGAVANQAGQLGTALGLGAGAAGGLLIAATAAQILWKALDPLNTEEAEAKEKASELAASLADQARSMEKAAEATATYSKQLEDVAKNIDVITEKYKLQTEAIHEATQARVDQIEFEQRKDDAEFRAGMAELKGKHPDGGAEFEKEKARLIEESNERRFNRDQQARDEKSRDASETARTAEEEARQLEKESRFIKRTGEGLLTNEERKAQEKKRSAAEQERTRADQDYDDAYRTTLGDEAGIMAQTATVAAQGDAVDTNGLSPYQYVIKLREEEQARKQQDAVRRGAKAEEDFKAADDALKEDKEARETSRFEDAGSLKSKTDELDKKAEEARERASTARKTGNDIGRKSEQEKEIFDINQRATRAEGSQNIRGAERVEKEKAEREQEKAGRERDRQDRDFGKRAGKVADRAEGAGLGAKGVAQLREAAELLQDTETGDQGQEREEVSRLLTLIVDHIKRMKGETNSQLAQVARDAAQALAAAESVRSAR